MKNPLPFQNTKLSFKKRVADLVSRLTLNEKIGLLPARQQAIARLGIKEWRVGLEIARGYVGREPDEFSTVFPQPVGLASTFNPEIMYALGVIAGTEARIYHKKYKTSKLMLFGPTVDLLRDPRWGRNEESYGEDPFLTGVLTLAYTKGISGEDKKFLRAIPMLKHFCANNHEEERVSDSADIEPRTLREYYYAAFEPAISGGGAQAVMTAYNELSGLPGMNNPDLRNVCKKEWGMLIVVTDGGDFAQNVLAHKHGLSHAETVAATVKAGNNIMLDNHLTVIEAGKEAIKQGLLNEKELDEAVSETLAARFMLGEFDEIHPYNSVSDELLNCEEFKQTNARAAREIITLMKNDGILPLKRNAKIAVVGPLADSDYPDWYTGKTDYHTTILQGIKNLTGQNIGFCDGCDIVAIKSLYNMKYLSVKDDGAIYADSDEITDSCRFKKIDWGGHIIYISEMNGKLLYIEEDNSIEINPNTPSGRVNASCDNTFEWFGKMIFKTYTHHDAVIFNGWRGKDLSVDENNRFCEIEENAVTAAKLFTEETVFDGIAESIKLAEKADYVIVCAGNNPMVAARECFDRKTLALPPSQQRLIDGVSGANKNTVLIIAASYPYSINREKENLPAIVYSAHGGPEMGGAVADVLFGIYNPAGRTPQTWYKSENDLPDIKDYDITNGSTYLYYKGETLYPFAHGLSYSTFEYSDFSVVQRGDTIEASVKIKNTSSVYGEEVVQLYFTALNSRVKRPVKQLCAFKRQGIEPGNTVEVKFSFDKSRLRFWDVTQNKFVTETGEYKFRAASTSEDIRCTVITKIKGEKIPPRNLYKKTAAINYDDKRGVKMLWDRERLKHYINACEKKLSWYAVLDFYNVDFDGAAGIQVNASMDAADGKITVYADGKEIGYVEIPAAAKPTGFKKRSAVFTKPLKATGKLSLGLSMGVNLLEFKLLKD